MYQNKKVVCVIPARLASQRFPHKMLATLAGRPLLAWAWEAANKVPYFDEVVCAVDDELLLDSVASFGGRAVLTSVDCPTGTDRLAELATRGVIDADVWVNWQGDEPFIHTAMVTTLLQSINAQDEDIWTLRSRITNVDDIASRHIAKVVCDRAGRALYFSRAGIPCSRDITDLAGMAQLVAQGLYYKHVGLYAFTQQALVHVAGMGSSVCEDLEKLEMLRWLEYGLRVQVHTTEHEVFGIDRPEDLRRAERVITP